MRYQANNDGARRYNRYRKKSRPEDKWASRGEKAARVAYKGFRLAKRLARFVNTEQKAVQTEISATTVAAGVVYPLSLIAQGDGYNQRDGISIKNSRLSGRFQVNYDTAATNGSVVRCIIFKYKQENGVAPTTANILDTTGGLDWLAPKFYPNRFQSKVLMDKLITLSEAGTMVKVCDVDIKLYGHTNYGGTGGAVTDIDDGGYYFLIITDVGASGPSIFAQFRLTFVDN